MPWKPGQTGNPNGKPKLPAEVREMKAAKSADVIEYINKYFDMPVSDLNDLINRLDGGDIPEGLTNLELGVARVMQRAIEKADYKALNTLLDRMIGKVKLEVLGTGLINPNPTSKTIHLAYQIPEKDTDGTS